MTPPACARCPGQSACSGEGEDAGTAVPEVLGGWSCARGAPWRLGVASSQLQFLIRKFVSPCEHV